jgi:hypothetical protein
MLDLKQLFATIVLVKQTIQTIDCFSLHRQLSKLLSNFTWKAVFSMQDVAAYRYMSMRILRKKTSACHFGKWKVKSQQASTDRSGNQ